MDILRESALEREGAQAAARGQHWRSNPFLLKDNMPQASGESLGAWSRWHDAWQRGFEGYFQQGPEFARQRQEKLSADLLKTMAGRSLRWLPGLRNFTAKHKRPGLVQGLTSSTTHDRDHQGHEWDLEDHERSRAGTTRIDAQLRAIVQRLRGPHGMPSTAEAAALSNGRGCPSPRGSIHAPCLTAMSSPAGESRHPAQTHAASAPLQPGPAPLEAPGATDLHGAHLASQEEPLRRELGIRRIGWRYEYRGYRYDRLADAVAYAKLDRVEPRGEAVRERSLLADEPPTMPSSEDRKLMDTWDIGFDAGIYTFQNYRYERLCDAVAYARLLASRCGTSTLQEHQP